MMEEVEQSEVNQVSGVAEEETPPEETNSGCNHNDDGVTSSPAEATPENTPEATPENTPEATPKDTPEDTPEVTVETGQSEAADVPVAPQKLGPVVVQSNNKNPASGKLQRVRRWSISTYKCTRQALQEKLGRGSRTVDLDLEPRLELLRDDRQRYENCTRLAQTLANQLAQFTVTQKALGDAFSDLSLKTPQLNVEFGLNGEAQKFLSKSGQNLSQALIAFTTDMNTLINKTIEDTMINAKQYEAARIEYDAYRVDLEELNLGPRDAATLPKLERAQKEFQSQREKYEKVRDDLSVKIKLLEENKAKVLHHQLWLLHGAVAAHFLSCHSFLGQNIQQAMKRLGDRGTGAPSWLEES